MKLLTYSALAVRRQREALRRAAGREAEDLLSAVRVDHRHLAARLQRDEQVDAARVERRRARDARVVVIDALRVVLGARLQVDARADRANRVLEVEAAGRRGSMPRLTLSCLEGTPGRAAVRRDRRGAEVVRHAAALVLRIRDVAVAQHDGPLDGHRRAVHDHDFAADRLAADWVCTAAVLSPGSGGRDEPRDVHAVAVGAHRDVAWVCARRRGCRASHPSPRRS